MAFFNKTPAEKVISKAIQYTAKENIQGLMGLISPDFKTEDGMGYKDVSELLTQIFKEFDDIKVIVDKQEEKIVEKHKYVTVIIYFKVIASFNGRRGYVAGGPTNTEQMNIDFINENSRWSVRSITGYRINKDVLKDLDTFL